MGKGRLRSLATVENSKVEVVVILVLVVLFLLIVFIVRGGGVRLWDLGTVPVPVSKVADASLHIPLPAREHVPHRGLDGECGVTAQRGRKQGSSSADLLDPFRPIAGHGRHRHAPAV
jgi:hypothetical protein